VEQHPLLAQVTARIGAAAALLTVLTGCGAAPAEPVRGTRLAAALTSPTDIALRWQGTEPDIAGRVVEFATEPSGPWTVLEFTQPDRTTFTHPDLMPETPFYYRVRPFSGPASDWVDVTLPAGPLTDDDAGNDHEWAVPRVLPGGPPATASARTGGRPTEFTAIVKHANGIAFTWTDNANGEEGYLIEVRPAGKEVRVAAVVDPNVNATGLVTLPDEKVASYRVRAFHYGQSSNLVNLRTGKDS
jgi:hypothetical protein